MIFDTQSQISCNDWSSRTQELGSQMRILGLSDPWWECYGVVGALIVLDPICHKFGSLVCQRVRTAWYLLSLPSLKMIEDRMNIPNSISTGPFCGFLHVGYDYCNQKRIAPEDDFAVVPDLGFSSYQKRCLSFAFRGQQRGKGICFGLQNSSRGISIYGHNYKARFPNNNIVIYFHETFWRRAPWNVSVAVHRGLIPCLQMFRCHSCKIF